MLHVNPYNTLQNVHTKLQHFSSFKDDRLHIVPLFWTESVFFAFLILLSMFFDPMFFIRWSSFGRLTLSPKTFKNFIFVHKRDRGALTTHHSLNFRKEVKPGWPKWTWKDSWDISSEVDQELQVKIEPTNCSRHQEASLADRLDRLDVDKKGGFFLLLVSHLRLSQQIYETDEGLVWQVERSKK